MKQAHNEFDGYFLWLGALVNADWDRYSELLYMLHNMDFVWCLDRDDGRASDGLELRKEYWRLDPEQGDWVMLMDKSCSVFEALVGLARRMDDILLDENTPDRVCLWFWEFVRNLGLKKYSNIRLETGNLDSIESDMIDIQMILLRWMYREFEPDGTGSIFPLREPVEDQREQTLIYQLNAYVIENYVE